MAARVFSSLISKAYSVQHRIKSQINSTTRFSLPYYFKYTSLYHRPYFSAAEDDQFQITLPSIFQLKTSPVSSTQRRSVQLNCPSTPWRILSVNDIIKLLFFSNGKIFFPIWTKFSCYGKYDNISTDCFGFSHGWFIIGDFYSYRYDHSLHLSFLNPTTNQRIQLPPFEHDNSFIWGTSVILTSCPENNKAKVIIKDRDGWVNFCVLGDGKWFYGTTQCSQSVVFFKGVVYGIDYVEHNEVVTYVFDEDAGKISQRPFPLKKHKEFGVGGKYYDYHLFSLVESGGELLLVARIYKCLDSRIVKLGVFKLDFETRSWVELTSLGDHILLLGEAGSMSVDVMEFSHLGFEPNCIYQLYECGIIRVARAFYGGQDF